MRDVVTRRRGRAAPTPGPAPAEPAASVRDVVAGVRRRAVRSDLMLAAAALTAYAVLGLVPLLAIGIRVAAGVLGAPTVVATGRDISAFVPGPLGVDAIIDGVVRNASGGGWWWLIAAVVAVSFYAEGVVRCLERFSAAPERRSRTLRGRLLTGPAVATVVSAVFVVVTVLRPLLENPFGRGTAPRLLGILVAFCVLWAGFSGVLCLIYRLFATTPIRARSLLVAGLAAGSWLAGQTLGYVAVLRLLGGFAHAYGGFAPAGAVAAIAFFLYLDHIVLLAGYALALYLHEARPFGPTHDHAEPEGTSSLNYSALFTPSPVATPQPARRDPRPSP